MAKPALVTLHRARQAVDRPHRPSLRRPVVRDPRAIELGRLQPGRHDGGDPRPASHRSGGAGSQVRLNADLGRVTRRGRRRPIQILHRARLPVPTQQTTVQDAARSPPLPEATFEGIPPSPFQESVLMTRGRDRFRQGADPAAPPDRPPARQSACSPQPTRGRTPPVHALSWSPAFASSDQAAPCNA